MSFRHALRRSRAGLAPRLGFTFERAIPYMPLGLSEGLPPRAAVGGPFDSRTSDCENLPCLCAANIPPPGAFGLGFSLVLSFQLVTGRGSWRRWVF